MNELYRPLVFFASLEFKCMQRSKPPFRRKRWCNKQKPPDSSHSSPSPTVYQSQPSSHTQRCYCKQPPGGRSAQECFFPSSFPSSLPHAVSSAVCLSAQSECRHTHAFIHAKISHIHWTTYEYEFWFPWGKSRCLLTAVHVLKKNACADVTSQLLPSSGWHCSFSLRPHYACMWPRSDFRRSQPPHSPTTDSSNAAPHDQGLAASHIPSQLPIYWLPIYTRLLMATVINFTGRQSNKALLWGLQQMSDVTFKVFFRRTLSRRATTLVLEDEIREEGGVRVS